MRQRTMLALLLVLLLCVTLTACGQETPAPTQAPTETPTTVPTEAPTAAPAEAPTTLPATEPVEENVYARTQGTWLRNGQPDGYCIVMDGMGSFTCYTDEGVLDYEGHLEYEDEFGDGNGWYILYCTGEDTPMASFAFHEENEFHFGNGEGDVYILATLPTAPVLAAMSPLPGLAMVEAMEDWRGGYFYEDITEDGLTTITNCCFANAKEDTQTMEDYLLWIAQDLSMTEPREFAWEESMEHSQRMTYPVYLLTWETGGQEDTQGWNALCFLTDTHTYLYAFHTPIDFREDQLDSWLEVFASLTMA